MGNRDLYLNWLQKRIYYNVSALSKIRPRGNTEIPPEAVREDNVGTLTSHFAIKDLDNTARIQFLATFICNLALKC